METSRSGFSLEIRDEREVKRVAGRAARIIHWVTSREEEVNSLKKGEIQIFFAGQKMAGKLIEFMEDIG